MTFRIRDAEFCIFPTGIVNQDALAGDVIAGYYGQGSAHSWTPQEWDIARSTGKPLHVIVFWGHAAADAIAQAKAIGAVVVWYDVEGQFTAAAIASGQPQAFGDACRAAGFPCAAYGTDDFCNAVASHFDGTVRYRLLPPTTVNSTEAYQYIHLQDYDESVAANDFPGGPRRPMSYVVVGDGTVPDPIGPGAEYVTDGITKRWIDSVNESSALLALFGQSGIVKMNQAALNEIPLWGAGPTPPATGTVTVTGSGLKVSGP